MIVFAVMLAVSNAIFITYMWRTTPELPSRAKALLVTAYALVVVTSWWAIYFGPQLAKS